VEVCQPAGRRRLDQFYRVGLVAGYVKLLTAENFKFQRSVDKIACLVRPSYNYSRF
jgi:hypothetical protein